MDWLAVRQRIEIGRDQRTEFQPCLGDFSGIGKALCAFGNRDEGGLIVLGVDDSGAIAGVTEDTDRVRARLTDFLETGCSVPVSAQCGGHREPSGWVHWIDVRRQHRRFEPVHFDGRYWFRRGRSSVQPSLAETQALFHDFGFVLAEGQVIRSASASDIDEAAFRDFLRAQNLEVDGDPQVPIEVDMANAEVLAPPEGRVSTLYGLMAFGRAPQNHPQTSGFFIQCRAYADADADRGTPCAVPTRRGG